MTPRPTPRPRRPDLAGHSIVIHSLDPVSQARFWSLATGLPPVDEDDGVSSPVSAQLAARRVDLPYRWRTARLADPTR